VNQVSPYRTLDQAFVYHPVEGNGVIESCSGGDYLSAVFDLGAFDREVVFGADKVGPGRQENQRSYNSHRHASQYEKSYRAPDNTA